MCVSIVRLFHASMDSFQSCARLMLHELYVLLQRTPTVFASTRLVQLMAVNMFSIHNLRTRGECKKQQKKLHLSIDFSCGNRKMSLEIYA